MNSLAPERIYAIGDVHGQLDQLRALHAAIGDHWRQEPAGSALLVHLGDYVDRGPDSAGCLATLAGGAPDLGFPIVNLMGNHERMMLDALASFEAAPLWFQNGGVQTLESFGLSPWDPHADWRSRIPADTLAWLEGLALSHLAGRFAFAHAGVRPGIRWSAQDSRDLLWIRREFLDWDGPMLPDLPDAVIVHGHTPSPAPEVRWNRIGLDTNAVRGGKLTCAVLSSDSVYFLQV